MWEWLRAAAAGVACWCTLFCLLLWLWESGWIRPHWRHLEGNPFPPLGHAFPKRRRAEHSQSSARWLNQLLQKLFYEKDSVLFGSMRMHLIEVLQRRLDDYRQEYGWLVEGLRVTDFVIGEEGPSLSAIRVHETRNETYLVAKVSFEGRIVISLQSNMQLGMGEWKFQTQFGHLQSLACLRIRHAPHPCVSIMLTRMPKFNMLLDWGQTSMAKLSNLMHYLVRNLIRTRLVYPAWTTVHLRTTPSSPHIFLLPKPAPLQPSLMLRIIEGQSADDAPIYVYATLGSNQRFRTESLIGSPVRWNQVHWFNLTVAETDLHVQMYSKRRKISKSVLLAEVRILIGSLLPDRIEQRLLTFEAATLRIELFWQTGSDQPSAELIFPNGLGPLDTSPMVPPNWNSLRSALAAMRQQNTENELEEQVREEEHEGDEEDEGGDEGDVSGIRWPLLPIGHRRHSIPQLRKPLIRRTWSQTDLHRPTWLCHWGEIPVEVERGTGEAGLKLLKLNERRKTSISLILYLHTDLDYVDVSAAHLLYSPLSRPHCLEGTLERVCIFPQGTSIYHAPVQVAWNRISRLTVTWYPPSHTLLRFDVHGQTPLYYLADYHTTLRLYRWMQSFNLPEQVQGDLVYTKHGVLMTTADGECRLLDRFFGAHQPTGDVEPRTWILTKNTLLHDDFIWEQTGIIPNDPMLEFSCSYLRRGIVVGKLSIFPGWLVILGRRNGWRPSKFAMPMDHLLRAELTSRWMNRGILLTLEGGEEMFLFGFKRDALNHCMAALLHFQMNI